MRGCLGVFLRRIRSVVGVYARGASISPLFVFRYSELDVTCTCSVDPWTVSYKSPELNWEMIIPYTSARSEKGRTWMTQVEEPSQCYKKHACLTPQ